MICECVYLNVNMSCSVVTAFDHTTTRLRTPLLTVIISCENFDEIHFDVYTTSNFTAWSRYLRFFDIIHRPSSLIKHHRPFARAVDQSYIKLYT